MKLKPVLYLRNSSQATGETLQRLAQLGFPVLLAEEDFGICSRNPELFSCFAEGQVQPLPSVPGESEWKSLTRLALQMEWTHVLLLSQFHGEILQAFVEQVAELVKRPFEFVFFTEPKSEEKKNNPFMQRLLDLGEFDYRQLKGSSAFYPVFFLQALNFSKQNQSDESRILVSCLKRRLPYRAISVAQKQENRSVDWKQKFWDFYLLGLSSLHRDQNPLHSALSFAMGAFVACTPFYGLQTGLIILFAMLFRLSFPVAFLGSQISLPPIYSLIVPLQIYVGFQLTGTPFSFDGPLLEVAGQHFMAWLIGSMVVGGLIATVMGLIWYWVQRDSQSQKVNWTGRMRGGRFGNALMIFLSRRLGLRFGYFLLFFIVPYFYVFAPRARRGLAEYYQIIRPQLSWWGRQWAIVKHLYKFAQILVDQAFQASRDEISFEIQYMSGNVLKQHLEPGARVMMFSHFGGWAISTQGFSRRNSEKPIHLIRYQAEALSSDKVFREKNKSNLHNILIKPGEPVFMALHEVLGQEGHLAIMGDRPFDNNFELKNFLGRLAPIPSTPFRLAKTYSAKLSFIVGFRRGYKTYGLASQTLDLSQLSLEEAMQEYLRFLTQYLTEYPDQWFNLYSFWSSLPTLPNGALCHPVKNQMEKRHHHLVPARGEGQMMV